MIQPHKGQKATVLLQVSKMEGKTKVAWLVYSQLLCKLKCLLMDLNQLPKFTYLSTQKSKWIMRNFLLQESSALNYWTFIVFDWRYFSLCINSKGEKLLSWPCPCFSKFYCFTPTRISSSAILSPLIFVQNVASKVFAVVVGEFWIDWNFPGLLFLWIGWLWQEAHCCPVPSGLRS